MKIFPKILKGLLFVLTFVILYFPIVIIATLSINESARATEFTGVTFHWYTEIVRDEVLLQAILNTLMVAIISTILSTIIGTLVAIGIVGMNKKPKKILLFLNNVPIINPDIVTGISLMIVFSFIGFRFGFPTMLIAHIFFSIPYVVLTVLPKLRMIDSNLYNAALDLGCNPLNAIIKVIVPAIKTGIIAGGLIAFTMSIDDFVISYFTTGNGFTNFSNWIYARLSRKSFTPAAYAYNTLITTLTILILVIVNVNTSVKQKNMLKKKKGV